MKSKLVLSTALLFGLALTAQAQLLSLSIGRHGFYFGIGLPFFCWHGPAVCASTPAYGDPAPSAYSPPPLAHPASQVESQPTAAQPQDWMSMEPPPGHWVPEPHPYSYTPSTKSAPPQPATVTKGTGGMLIYSSR